MESIGPRAVQQLHFLTVCLGVSVGVEPGFWSILPPGIIWPHRYLTASRWLLGWGSMESPSIRAHSRVTGGWFSLGQISQASLVLSVTTVSDCSFAIGWFIKNDAASLSQSACFQSLRDFLQSQSLKTFPCERTVIRYDKIWSDWLYKAELRALNWCNNWMLDISRDVRITFWQQYAENVAQLNPRQFHYQQRKKLKAIWGIFGCNNQPFLQFGPVSLCVPELRQDLCFCIHCLSGKHEALQSLKEDHF